MAPLGATLVFTARPFRTSRTLFCHTLTPRLLRQKARFSKACTPTCALVEQGDIAFLA